MLKRFMECRRDLMRARMAQARQETKYNATTGQDEAKRMLPRYAEGRRAAYSVINRKLYGLLCACE